MPTFDDNMTDATSFGPVAPSRALSAVGFSLLLHAAVFLLLAFIAQPPRLALLAEPERAVQFVLARGTHRSLDQYQDRTDSIYKEGAPSTDASSPGASLFTDAVPSLDQITQLIPRELALPKNDAATNAAGVLPTQRLAASHDSGSRIPIAGDPTAFIAAEQSRLRANRPYGSPATVKLFDGKTAEGRTFIFVIDRSKSMERVGLGALPAAEEELLVALRHLEPNHKFQVIAYNHDCIYLGRRELLPATEENKQALRGFLDGLAAFGATEHEMALQSALRHQPDVIYLLTDGGDPELSEAKLRKITKLAGTRTSIHCIQFGFGAMESEDNFLKRLAAMNRGGYEYLDLSRKIRER